jgi:hypothetical protein
MKRKQNQQQIPSQRTFALLSMCFLLASSAFAQTVSVSDGPTSPLCISNFKYEWTISEDGRWHMLEINFVMKNCGTKPIRAYATHLTEGDAQSRGGSLQFANLVAAKNFIRPGESRKEQISGNGYSEMAQQMTLAIDFVEFSDGSTWGADVGRSAEGLAGQRAGGKAELERVRQIEQDYGIEGLVNSVSEEATETVAPEGKPPEWREGYRMGVNFVRGRVRGKYKEGGPEAVRAVLAKPYDESSEQ